jgi:hypothetical protein
MQNETNQLEQLIQAVVRNLKTEFWIWATALGILTGMVYLFSSSFPKLDVDVTIQLQSILILILLLGFPAVFIWFRNSMQKIRTLVDVEARLKRFERFSRLRQAVFFCFGFMILVVKTFTNLKGAHLLLMIVVALGFFIIPSRSRLIMENHLYREPEVKEEEEVEEKNDNIKKDAGE